MPKPKKPTTPTPPNPESPSPFKRILARPDLDIEVTKYKNTRFYAVFVAGNLLAVTVYKKGAIAIRNALYRRC